jgi:hypothetical protein
MRVGLRRLLRVVIESVRSGAVVIGGELDNVSHWVSRKSTPFTPVRDFRSWITVRGWINTGGRDLARQLVATGLRTPVREEVETREGTP